MLPPDGFELIITEEFIVKDALLFEAAFVPSPANDAASVVPDAGSVKVAAAIPLEFVTPDPVDVPSVNVTVLPTSGKKLGPDLNSSVAWTETVVAPHGLDAGRIFVILVCWASVKKDWACKPEEFPSAVNFNVAPTSSPSEGIIHDDIKFTLLSDINCQG